MKYWFQHSIKIAPQDYTVWKVLMAQISNLQHLKEWLELTKDSHTSLQTERIAYIHKKKTSKLLKKTIVFYGVPSNIQPKHLDVTWFG